MKSKVWKVLGLVVLIMASAALICAGGTKVRDCPPDAGRVAQMAKDNPSQVILKDGWVYFAEAFVQANQSLIDSVNSAVRWRQDSDMAGFRKAKLAQTCGTSETLMERFMKSFPQGIDLKPYLQAVTNPWTWIATGLGAVAMILFGRRLKLAFNR